MPPRNGEILSHWRSHYNGSEELYATPDMPNGKLEESPMLYLDYVPPAPLSQFVNQLWLYEGYTQPHAKERILPTGEMQIVVN